MVLVTAILSIVVLAIAGMRREKRLMISAYYQQKEAESLAAARQERYVADLAAGEVNSPILPFLNPIGKPERHRARAAEHDERATEYGRISQDYDDAAARPWQAVDVFVRVR